MFCLCCADLLDLIFFCTRRLSKSCVFYNLIWNWTRIKGVKSRVICWRVKERLNWWEICRAWRNCQFDVWLAKFIHVFPKIENFFSVLIMNLGGRGVEGLNFHSALFMSFLSTLQLDHPKSYTWISILAGDHCKYWHLIRVQPIFIFMAPFVNLHCLGK